MEHKRILAFIITYHPDERLLKENLHAFKEHVDSIVVWDNTPGGSNLVQNIVETELKTALYVTESLNKGISYALNWAWRYAQDNEFDYLLTMDQDSVWQNFGRFLRHVLSAQAPRGIFGPKLWTDKLSSEIFERTDYVITSGMLVAIDILNRIGGYRSDFFVDGIDLEFCLRAKTHGIYTYRLSNCLLRQRFGTPKTITLFGHDNHTANYAPRRLREILRTHVLILCAYPCSALLRRNIIITYFWKLPLKLLFLESEKRKKFRAFFQGIQEGWHSICNNKVS